MMLRKRASVGRGKKHNLGISASAIDAPHRKCPFCELHTVGKKSVTRHFVQYIHKALQADVAESCRGWREFKEGVESLP